MSLRVSLVLGRYSPSLDAVAQGTLRLAEALASHGARATVYTTRASAREATGPLEVVGALDVWRPGSLPSLVLALARAKPDVVHIQYAPSSYGHSRAVTLLPPMLRALGLPTVATVHEYGGWDYDLPRVPRGLLRQVARFGEGRGYWDREALTLVGQSGLVFTTNALHRDLLVSRLPSRADRIRIAPIGPNVSVAPGDPAEHRAAVRAELGIAPDAPVAAFFGFIHPVKGIGTLLRALASVREARPDARLLLIGGFESLALPGEEAARYRREVEESIAALGLGDAVTITGYLHEHEVSRLLLAADLACMPFNHGVTAKSGALHAVLAHGLPTVVTRAEPPEPELVEGVSALIVPPKDAGALARAMLDLVERPDVRARLSAGALEVAARHSWDAIARLHVAAYDEVAPRRVGASERAGSRPASRA